MAKEKTVSILVAVREEFSKVFPRISRVVRAVRRDLQQLKTPAGVVRVAFRNMRRAGRGVITSFRRIRSAAGRLRRALLSVRSVVGALFAAFVVGRGIRSLLETVEGLDRLAKTSDKLGILPERLAELRFAAEQSGVAITALDLGLQRMIRRVAEAAVGTGEAQGALKDLGLDAEELARQSPDQIFLAISEAMLKVKDEGERIRLTFKLFDTEGVALKNTLALGADELERLFVQARALGLTLDRDQLRIVERLSDAINRMRRAWQGLKQTLAISVAPVLTKLIDDLTVVVVVLPKLIDNLSEQLRKSFSEGAEGRQARGKITEAIRSLFTFITDLVVESVRVLVFAFVQTLIVAFKAFAPQLEALGADLLFRISEGALGKPLIFTEERKQQIRKEIEQLNVELQKETARFRAKGQRVGRADRRFADLFDPKPVVRLRKQIKALETELSLFNDVKTEAERSRQAFEAELALTADVMTQAFASAGDEIKDSGAALLDAFKELVDFDVAADPKLIEDLKGQIAGIRAELGDLEDFDIGQAESVEGAIASLEKLIELREAEVAGDKRRVVVLQQEIRQTAELVQLRANLAKSGEGQSEQAQNLIDRLTDLQAAEQRSLELRLTAQTALDRVLEAEGALRRAIQDREAAVALGVVTQQTAIAATDAQTEALRVLAVEASNTIAALAGGEELEAFIRQIEDVVRNLQSLSDETGGILGGIGAGFQDFITEASNSFRQFQGLTSDLLGTIRGGFSGIFSGVIRGTEDVAMAFENMLFRMLDQVIVFLTDQIILQFLQLFTAEGVLGQAFLGFTDAIGLGGAGEAVTGGAAAGVEAITGVAEEGAEAASEVANTVALEVNTAALSLNTTALGTLVGALSTAAGTVSAVASAVAATVTTAATTVVAAVAPVVASLAANTAAVAANTSALITTSFFGAGGTVPGPRMAGDVVAARLTPGEFVLRRQSAQWYGRSIMEALNRRLIPRSVLDEFGIGARPIPVAVPAFAAGGQVQAGAAPAPSVPIPAVILPDEQAMERLLAGGENAMLRFLEEHAPAVSALIDRNRGLP